MGIGAGFDAAAADPSARRPGDDAMTCAQIFGELKTIAGVGIADANTAKAEAVVRDRTALATRQAGEMTAFVAESYVLEAGAGLREARRTREDVVPRDNATPEKGNVAACGEPDFFLQDTLQVLRRLRQQAGARAKVFGEVIGRFLRGNRNRFIHSSPQKSAPHGVSLSTRLKRWLTGSASSTRARYLFC